MRNSKTTVYLLTFFFLVLPFILVTDLFPFLRFGMFAEKVRLETQTEQFFVRYTVGNQSEKFDPEKFELQEEIFQYLARNYYYRGEGKKLLQNIHALRPNDIRKIELYRVTFDPSEPNVQDTVLLTSL